MLGDHSMSRITEEYCIAEGRVSYEIFWLLSYKRNVKSSVKEYLYTCQTIHLLSWRRSLYHQTPIVCVNGGSTR